MQPKKHRIRQPNAPSAFTPEETEAMGPAPVYLLDSGNLSPGLS